MAKPTLPPKAPSEPAAQFRRSVEKIQLARQTHQDPAPYVANAQQWLAIVRLTDPREAKTLELELKHAAGPLFVKTAEKPADKPSAADRNFLLLRLAWVGVPFAVLYTIAGPDLGVKVIAGACFIGLLAFIFLR